MKKILTLSLTLSLSIVHFVKAQQDPQFTQFMYIKQAYNPAFVGTDGTICFNALYRQQWVNFPGAPKTGLFAFNMPIAKYNLGVGMYIANDQLGAMAQTLVRAQLAYHIHIPTKIPSLLSVGVDGGVLQTKINGTFIAPQTMNDPLIPSNPLYNSGTLGQYGTNSPLLNKIIPDFSLGLYYAMPNKMYVGLSSTHLAGTVIQGSQATGLNPQDPGYNLSFDVTRHYYLISGYTFSFSGGEHKLTPNIKIKTDGSITQADFNLTYMLQNQFWLGATYRLQDAIAPMVGWQGKGFKIGYSYDITLSQIKGYSAGTHEIFLGYCMKPKPVPKKASHWNVRYFED